MKKNLRLVSNRLSIILLLSIVFLSIPQQEFSSKYRLLVACSESVTATYPELNFSTYLGGSDGGELGRGIVTTNNGSYYVTGHTKSNNFPTLHAYNNTFSGDRDVFITKFSGSNSLLWSTYFGGSDVEGSFDIAVIGDSSCYITGFTRSSDFPVQNAYDSTYMGSDDAFLAKFAANGSLIWSTFLGGSDRDFGHSIAVTGDSSIYVTGETWSSNFPTKNAYDSTYNGWYTDAFVAKFSAEGTLLWSTFLGGNGNEAGHGLAVSSDGSCYVTGLTRSTDFPTQNGYDTTSNGD
ncbi:MAG: SBBP repeat-containing protein [Candidatus Heimdallarchaeota archaeon]